MARNDSAPLACSSAITGAAMVQTSARATAALVVANMIRPAIILLAFTLPAHADWQFTWWGMSPEDVIAAGKTKTARLSTAVGAKSWSIEGVGEALVSGKYATEQFRFTVHYLFRSKKLTAVKLTPEPVTEGVNVAAQLGLVYGRVTEQNEEWDPSRTCLRIHRAWRDEAGGNVVQFNDYHCIPQAGGLHFSSIMYEPIVTKGSSGL